MLASLILLSALNGFENSTALSSVRSGFNNSVLTPQIGILHPQQICSLPGANVSSSVFYSRTTDIKTTDPGVFLEDESNGDIYWCSIDNTFAPNNATLIAHPPHGAHGAGYYGMGGYETGGGKEGVVLVVTSYVLHGMWFCYFATLQNCEMDESAFIPFPASYCSTLATGTCNPYGTALDSSLNVYWVDPQNDVFSECTSISNYSTCFSLPSTSSLSGRRPIGLALVNNTAPDLNYSGWTFYITDYSCKGFVWEGNGTSNSPLVPIAQVGDSLEGIGTTTKDVGFTQQLLVGDSGRCHDKPAKIIDLSNDTQVIPTNFSGPSSIIGISVCWGQCLQNLTGSRQLFYTSSSNGTVWISGGRLRQAS